MTVTAYPSMNKEIVSILRITDDNPVMMYAAARIIEELENQLEQFQSLRPEVQRFALAMEERLKANDHKGGWENCTTSYLWRRLVEESGELEEELAKDLTDGRVVLHEAADVANFAMMLADVYGALK